MTYEQTPLPAKPEVKDIRTTKTKKDKDEVNKEQLNKTIADHKAAIAKSKQDIKKYKLLIKQAKITYKLTQMKGNK